ncbi:MAG: S1 family peptidase [Blastocatellia bacterium]
MRIAILLLTLASTVGVATGQDKSVSIEAIDRAKYAIVPIVCGAPQQNGDFTVTKIMGTGFFINEEGYFLTARHVMADWDKIDTSKGACAPFIYLAIGGWKNGLETPSPRVRYFRFTSCQISDQVDIAVCKPIDNPFKDSEVKKDIRFLEFTDFSGRDDGSPVAFTAYPLDFLRPVTAKGYIASYIPASNQIVIDRTAWPGASGSPVYLSDGRVIGVILQTGIGLGSGLAYARPSESVLDFLTANHINFHNAKQH